MVPVLAALLLVVAIFPAALAAQVEVTRAGQAGANLVKAAKAGDTDTVEELLAVHRKEIAEANSGVPAVKAAAERGHTETVLALIDSPAVDRSKALQNAAVLAAKGGFIDTVLRVTKLGGSETHRSRDRFSDRLRAD